VTEDDEASHRINTLWVLLAVLLVLGASGSATVVFGVTGAFAGDPWDLIALPVGVVVAVLSFLFMAGLLYRVDRYRGVNARRIELFE
jgi:Na+/proline symporter